MQQIKKSPYIALLFSALALLTAAAFFWDLPRLVELLLAAFWTGTGALGLYVACKN